MHSLYRPGRPPTVNGENKRSIEAAVNRTKSKNRFREDFYFLALAADFEGLGPCEVHVVQHLKNRSSEPDIGSCFFAYKAAQDGLVDAGVWPDDNRKWVREVRFLDHLVTGEDGLELRLIPIAE